MFNDEEIKAAKATREAIISGNISELKSVYMAGEICMWDEMQSKASQDGWVRVEDEKPPKNTTVIGYFPEGTEGSGRKPVVGAAIRYSDDVISDFPNSTAYCFVATHWQPLPQPPKTI